MVAPDALEQGKDFLFGHGEVYALGVQVALGHGHDVQGSVQFGLMQAEQLTEHPFDAVPAYCAAHLSAYRRSQSPIALIGALADEEQEVPGVVSPARVVAGQIVGPPDHTALAREP